MNNIDLLFTCNREIRPQYRIKDGKVIFIFYDKVFDGNTVRKILGMINGFKSRHGNNKIPICLYFPADQLEIWDKLSYVLFECICYHLIHNLRHPLEVHWKPKDTIWTQGVFSSPLLKLSRKGKPKIEDFEQHFHMDLYGNHFRRLVSIGEKLNTNYLGKLYQEIDSFLKVFEVKAEHRDDIAHMCSELVGNAGEHVQADCLIDIDVTSDHGKWGSHGFVEGSFYAINIAVVNFSERLIGESLRKVMSEERAERGDRYKAVDEAFKTHSQMFSAAYDEEDFYNISVFQDRISGRWCGTQTGGTGLTLLIKNMQENADSTSCYMISGGRSIQFEKSLLEYDENGWIGFNKERDYFSNIPDINMINRCYIYMPGTAYNLNFVLKRETAGNE